MKLVTVEEMRQIEKQAIENGLTEQQMMENAGKGLAKAIHELLGEYKTSVIGLIGQGNNGGDTLIALTELAKRGWQVRAWVVSLRHEPDELMAKLLETGGEICRKQDDVNMGNLGEWLESSEVLLDGLLGTGARLPLMADYADLLKFIKYKKEMHVNIAVDCPSGVDCITGHAAPETLPADFTFCLGAVKTGLLKMPALELVGEMDVVPIGLPVSLLAWKAINREMVTANMVTELLPKRPMDSHKGTFGTAMISAGSTQFTGAALLAGKAAFRSGVGLVRMAIPGSLYPVLAGNFPEATWLLLPHEMGAITSDGVEVFQRNFKKTNAILLGPGWGEDDHTLAFLEQILKKKHIVGEKKHIGFVTDSTSEPAANIKIPPLIIDADGLNLLCRIDNWETLLPPQTILTPHPGEMAHLTGRTVEEIQANRLEATAYYAKQWNCVMVLKGACTVIASPEGKIRVSPFATSALAKGGTGDVLAGIITGLRAQGLQAFDAATVGVWIHAQAGIKLEDDQGSAASILAGDILGVMGEVFADLEG